MFFEIRKPACQLQAAFLLTVITYSLVEMERRSVQHRIAAVGSLSKQSVAVTQCGFRQQVQRRDSPNHSTLILWILKWHQEGSVTDSKPQGRPLSARTPDSVEWVKDAMLQTPRRSARLQA